VTNAKSRAASISVMSNTVLVVGKFIIGLSMGSVAVISEAIHSSLDLLAAIVAFFAVKAASHPADSKHSFGHGKIENVSGTFEAILILVAAAWILFEAVNKLFHPEPIGHLGLGMAIMGVAAVVNIFVSSHLMKIAKQTDSIALEADAMHLKTDVYTAFGVMIGLGGVWLTGWEWLDAASAIVVAIIIMYAAWELASEAFKPLLDASLSEDEIVEITESIEKHKYGYIDFHNIRTRKSGSLRHVDLHLTVCKYDTVEVAHKLADDIENELAKRFKEIDALIHHEPCSMDCNGCEKMSNNKIC
jgi:cation diffusion facilitator family transporter